MRYFNLDEFKCLCGCGNNKMDKDFLDRLDKAREYSVTPYIISSGMRCSKHNEEVGGSETSSHLKGLAVDIVVRDSGQRYKILMGLIGAGFNRFGLGENFLHVDDDKSKQSNVIWVY